MESGAFDLNIRSDARRCAALHRIPLALHPATVTNSPPGLPTGQGPGSDFQDSRLKNSNGRATNRARIILGFEADRNLVGYVDCNPQKDKSLALGETMATMYLHQRISIG